MPNSRPTLRSLIGVMLTPAAHALVVSRVAGGAVAWWLPLSLLFAPPLALKRR